jgi:cell division protein FtsL
MDQQYIKEQRIVDRYLAGDLTVREARQFEKYCLEHPEVLQDMPIPVRLKARLSRQPLAHSETGMFETIPSSATIAATEGLGDEEEEEPTSERTVRRVDGSNKILMYSLLAAVVLLAVGTIYYGLRARGLADELQQLEQSVQRSQLQPASTVQHYKVQLSRSGVPTQPTLSLGWPDPAQLLELSVDTTELPYAQYQITIQKRDEARLLILRRLARDSNRELRLALNSSAFGPGQYVFKVEGYTWRGRVEPGGWFLVDLE